MSKSTTWGLAEIKELELDDFWAWLAQAQIVDNEIAQRVREQ